MLGWEGFNHIEYECANTPKKSFTVTWGDEEARGKDSEDDDKISNYVDAGSNC